MTGARRRVLVASAGGFLGMYLELSAVPYIAARHGGRFAAGLLTFALMLTTGAMQATIPFLLRRFTPRGLLVGGLVLIGAPTLLYLVSQSVPSLTAVTLVRGAGFGLLTVMGAALTAAYAHPRSRGSSLGAYGVTISAGAAFAPAVGVAITRSSLVAVFALGTVLPLLGVLALIPNLPPATIRSPRSESRPSSRPRALAAPVVVFTTIAASIAAAFTFVPLLKVGSTTALLALFGAGFAFGRLAGGRLLDRGYAATALVIEVLIGVVIGLALLGLSPFGVVAVGAAVSGIGMGCLATATLVMMLDRSGPHRMMRASVIWNITFDLGQALGAVAGGAIASLIGPASVFLAAAGLVALVAGPTAVFDWRHARPRVPAAA